MRCTYILAYSGTINTARGANCSSSRFRLAAAVLGLGIRQYEPAPAGDPDPDRAGGSPSPRTEDPVLLHAERQRRLHLSKTRDELRADRFYGRSNQQLLSDPVPAAGLGRYHARSGGLGPFHFVV